MAKIRPETVLEGVLKLLGQDGSPAGVEPGGFPDLESVA